MPHTSCILSQDTLLAFNQLIIRLGWENCHSITINNTQGQTFERQVTTHNFILFFTEPAYSKI